MDKLFDCSYWGDSAEVVNTSYFVTMRLVGVEKLVEDKTIEAWEELDSLDYYDVDKGVYITFSFLLPSLK